MAVLLRGVRAVLGVALIGTLVACGAQPAATLATPTPTADGSSPTPFSSPTSIPTPSSTPTPRSGSTPSGPPIVVASPGVTRQVLLLSDAFDPGEWTEGSYTPANEPAPVNNAMALQLSCTSRSVQVVEYRFAQLTGRVAVQVAQDMRSEASDAELAFSLEADGRQIEAKNINFKDKAELSTDLAGVTVLKVGVRAAPSSPCRSSKTVNALITSIVIQK